jgi:transcriptional regulator with XRE-family HTH domain
MRSVSGQTPLSRWLRREMPRRGYPLEGHRAGGITRLATETGISQATMSRMINGLGEPSVDSLRKIGQVFGYTLREMMVFAGLAESEEMGESVVRASRVALEESDDRLHFEVTVDPEVSMEQAIASLGELTSNERILVANLRAMEYDAAAVAGAVLLLRGHAERRGGQQDTEGTRKQA